MAFHRFGQLVREWHELEESGTPLEPFTYRIGVYPNGGLTIRQEPAPYESGIKELRSGRVAYVIPIFVRRDDPGKTIIRDCSLDVPWDDSIEWLDEGTGRNRKWYAFSKQTYPPPHEFARKTVLNHRMVCTLSRGNILEGLLLAVGNVRPPEIYRDGGIIPITFTILDQWDRKLPAIFKLRLERCPALDKKMKETTRESLLSRRAKFAAEVKAAADRWALEESANPGIPPMIEGKTAGHNGKKSEVSPVEKGGGKGVGAEKNNSKQ